MCLGRETKIKIEGQTKNVTSEELSSETKIKTHEETKIKTHEETKIKTHEETKNVSCQVLRRRQKSRPKVRQKMSHVKS